VLWECHHERGEQCYMPRFTQSKFYQIQYFWGLSTCACFLLFSLIFEVCLLLFFRGWHSVFRILFAHLSSGSVFSSL
jgi:hypothetical protein